MNLRDRPANASKRSVVRAAVLVLGALASVSVHAHAFLDHASPSVGAELARSPDRVTLWFTQQLEPAFSTIQVVDGSGNRVDRGDGQVDTGDAKQLHVSMRPLPRGKYKVVWRVVSLDSHVTEGDYVFQVNGK